jgi:hypothetical protein
MSEREIIMEKIAALEHRLREYSFLKGVPNVLSLTPDFKEQFLALVEYSGKDIDTLVACALRDFERAVLIKRFRIEGLTLPPAGTTVH